jgi:CDP-6-deoxy-D-xylo-4-hexulose-3-dehydrase
MSAAVGLRQLEKLSGFIRIRRANAAHFLERIAPLEDHFTPQREIGTSSWFGFSLLVEPRSRSREDVVAALVDAGIECRPIVTGNFARQEALRHIDHSVAGSLDGADRVHDDGLFVGNGERDLRPQIDHLADTLGRVVATAGATAAASAEGGS